jgi:hypothetical protein
MTGASRLRIPGAGGAAPAGARALSALRASWASPVDVATRLLTAALLAGGGYIHLDLYRGGYRYIPTVGTLFVIQESGAFAVAFLLVLSGAFVLRLAAAGLAAGALIGFVQSRTVGVSGFIEHGLQPSPQALASVLVEAATLIVVAASLLPPVLRAARGSRRTWPAPIAAGSDGGLPGQ